LSKLRTSLCLVVAVIFIGGCAASYYKPAPRVDTSNTVPRIVVGLMITYREALALVDKLEYDPAEVKLEQVSAQFDAAGDTAHTAESMFWLGFCREKLHRDDLARQTYVTVIERFAGTKPARYARTRLDAMNQS
jgi:TolA-binding protein